MKKTYKILDFLCLTECNFIKDVNIGSTHCSDCKHFISKDDEYIYFEKGKTYSLWIECKKYNEREKKLKKILL